MKTTTNQIAKWGLLFALATLSSTGLRAQSVDYWSNSGGGDWNTAANWNLDQTGTAVVPGVGVNADIGTLAPGIVTYTFPMAAPSFGALTVGSGANLTVSAAGFTLDLAGNATPAVTVNSGGALIVNTNGVLTITNGGGLSIVTGGSVAVNGGTAIIMSSSDGVTNVPLTLQANSPLVISNGGVMAITRSGRITMPTDSAIAINGGSLIMTNNADGLSGINMGANGANNGAGLTNNGGTIILDQRLEMRGRFSRFIMNGGTLSLKGTNGIFESSNDNERPWIINGGTASLGDFVISRTLPAPGAGFVISNGAVNVTSLRIGNAASRAFAGIYGGTLTNSGAFTIGDRNNGANSGERRIQMLVRGGTVVSTTPEGMIVCNQANTLVGGTAANMGSILDISAGTVIAEGLTLNKDATLTNAFATLLLSGGTVYLGPVGLVGNVGSINSSYTITFSGGTLAAKANHAINANIAMSGSTTRIQAADIAGTPFNIAVNGVLSGSGTLTKSGAGVLTLNGVNTYSGATIVNAGSLVVSGTGSIANTPSITLGLGTIVDLSAAGTYTLSSGRTLAGSGTVVGSIRATTGAIVSPGSNTVNGTLMLGSLEEQGGVINHLDLTTFPVSPLNDLIQVTGDLTVSGTNTFEIAGTLTANSAYRLVQYTGNFNGGLTNFVILGTPGSLSNDVSGKVIYLVTQTAIRAPGNVTWVGNAAVNDWDLVNRTNWLNNGALDLFVAGDNVRFDATGAANPIVNVVGNVAVGALTVDAAANYTLGGNGNITGSGGLTKTNSGTLSVLTTNTFAGATIVGGGWLEASSIRNSSVGSGIGAAPTVDPSFLQFNGGNLRYTGGNSSTDRGATLNSSATLDVSTAASTLTVNGVVAGAGGLTKAGPGTLVLSAANTYVGVNTVSNGTLQVNNAVTALGANNTVNLAGGTLFLNVGGQPSYGLALNLLSASGLNVAANNTIFTPTAWSGSDVLTVNVNSGGFFTINSGISPSFTGTIGFGTSAGLARFNAGGSSGGGQQATGSPAVTFDLGPGTVALVNRNGGGASFGSYNLGALAGGPNTQLRGSEGSGSTCTYVIGAKNVSTLFEGAIRNGFAGGTTPQASAAVSIAKTGTGTLTLAGTNTYTGSTTISNGVLALSGNGTIAGTAAIHLLPGAGLDSYARVDGALTLATGTLDGAGTIRGSLVVGSGATVSPGDASFTFGGYYIDQFTVTNAFILQPGSTLTMDVDTLDLTNDMIFARSITYGGTLNLQPISSLTVSNTLKLFSAGSYNGAFDAFNPPYPNFDPSLAWDTSRLTIDGTLGVIAQHPRLSSILLQGTDLTVSATNGMPGGTFYLLSSTNVALPLSQWSHVATNSYDGAGVFNQAIPGIVNPALPQNFYSLQNAQ